MAGHDVDVRTARDLDVGFRHAARPVFLNVADQLNPLEPALSTWPTISQGFLNPWEGHAQAVSSRRSVNPPYPAMRIRDLPAIFSPICAMIQPIPP